MKRGHSYAVPLNTALSDSPQQVLVRMTGHVTSQLTSRYTPTFVVVAHVIALAGLCNHQPTTLTPICYGSPMLIRSIVACNFTD